MAIREYTAKDVSDILSKGFDTWDAEQTAKLDQEAEREETIAIVAFEARARAAHPNPEKRFVLLCDKRSSVILAFLEHRWRFAIAPYGTSCANADWQGRFQFFDDAVNAALRAYAAMRFSGDAN